MLSSSPDVGSRSVAVLVPPGVVALDLAVPMQVFGPWPPDVAGDRLQGVSPYAVSLVGLEPDSRAGDALTVRGAQPLARLHDVDTVVVPGVRDPRQEVPDELRRAVAEASARGARLVSICTGAFVLAAAGVLDGRPATTHWRWAAELQDRFPEIDVQDQHLYIDDGAVLTSAGLLAGVDLCLHIVRRDLGTHIANQLARFLVSAPHRGGAQAQWINSPVGDEVGSLVQTRHWLVADLAVPHTLASIARHAGMSVRTLTRRFRAETGQTVSEWLVHQRVARAQELLERTDRSVAVIAQEVGFGSSDALRAHFVTVVGATPLRHRRRYRYS